MSQSDARKRRRECKRSGRHLLVKNVPPEPGEELGNTSRSGQYCAHCGTWL